MHWYGVLVAVGFVAGLWTASRRALRLGISPEQILDAGIWIIVGAGVGARALYAMSYWDRLMEAPTFPSMPWTEVFMIQKGGLVYYGGLIGASLATILYAWKTRIPLWRLADALAPSIALGYVPGRMGCFMNGCCYGRPTDLPWGVSFPPGSDAFGHAVHPTQIYDALLSLGLYAGLAWLYRRRRFEGQIFATYLIGYAITRSIVEIFRGDYSERYWGGLATPAQLVSIAIFIVGAGVYVALARRPARP